jgi:predicted lipoprotein with Yx(FWY)xxD motif
MTRRPAIAALIGAAVLAGCGGGGGSYGGGTKSNSSASSKPASGPALKVSSIDEGSVVVDSQGRTLYMFGKDTGGKSSCSGACATDWPPAETSGKPAAGTGVTGGKLTTTMRSDGTRQIVYAGHPLYRFSGDSSAGDAKGQGLNVHGGVWYVVSPAGAAITAKPNSGGGGGGSYGGGGY